MKLQILLHLSSNYLIRFYNLVIVSSFLMMATHPIMGQNVPPSDQLKPAIKKDSEINKLNANGTKSSSQDIDKENPEFKALKDQIKKIKLERELLKSSNELKEEQFKTKLFNLDKQIVEIQKLNLLEREKLQQRTSKYKNEKELIGIKQSRLQLANSRLIYEKSKLSSELLELKNKIEIHEQNNSWKNKVAGDVPRSMKPFQNGTLTISDRRVELNGVVHFGMAEKIIKDIEFYNNQNSDFPIFIVIDSSPGGSVMAGYQILTAMQSSRAPIYVVVKSFAASMAAIITGYANKSFALPNAVILHHQVSGFMAGNVTQQKEAIKITEEWMGRILERIAAKMGISLSKFVEMMYQKNSDGNWQEFADVAVNYKWIDHVVTEIRELSIIERKQEPDDSKKSRYHLGEHKDKAGHSYIRLPRLNPYDVYHLYNPDNYYRYP